MRFSANLGFLWTELALPDAIRAAAAAGFDAVECHWPYGTPAAEVRAALVETGLPMLGLNTRRGGPGENGLSALPGRQAEARAAIDEALSYASEISAQAVHVMAGIAEGPDAEAAFRANLAYAAEKAAPLGIAILIEPLNPRDAPGYFLRDSLMAERLIRALDLPALRLMFDCYHLEIVEGDLERRFAELFPIVGHVQIASVPDRGPPDHGTLDYDVLLRRIEETGWDKPIGAEYKPQGSTPSSLGWLAAAKAGRRERN